MSEKLPLKRRLPNIATALALTGLALAGCERVGSSDETPTPPVESQTIFSGVDPQCFGLLVSRADDHEFIFEVVAQSPDYVDYSFGDGSNEHTRKVASHRYDLPGKYVVDATVTITNPDTSFHEEPVQVSCETQVDVP